MPIRRVCDRTLSIGSHEIQALHVVRPGPFDLVAIANAPEDRQDVPPLPWFGPEVSAEPTYQRRRLALHDAPEAPEVEFTNAALNSLLDLLEDRFTNWPGSHEAARSDEPAIGAVLPTAAPVAVLESEGDEDINDLGIEDALIRELARSLQPRQR